MTVRQYRFCFAHSLIHLCFFSVFAVLIIKREIGTLRKNNSSCFNIFYIIIELAIDVFMLPIKILKAISDILSELK